MCSHPLLHSDRFFLTTDLLLCSMDAIGYFEYKAESSFACVSHNQGTVIERNSRKYPKLEKRGLWKIQSDVHCCHECFIYIKSCTKKDATFGK